MNFLSHFYFTQQNNDPYYSLGTILPDLLRNHDKSWKFYPEKEKIDFNDNSHLAALAKGWALHVQVDKIFHSSSLFALHSSTLRNELAPIFTRLPIRPFFLAHVGYELLLDSLLIHDKQIDTHLFYQHIGSCDPRMIHDFLSRLGISETIAFSGYLNSFIQNRYLENYTQPKNIVSALDYIGNSVWNERFNKTEILQAELVFRDFQYGLRQNFMDVFELIEKEISENT